MARAPKANSKLTGRSLPLTRLALLAARLTATKDEKEADALRKKFLEGYYGKSIRLTDAEAVAVLSAAGGPQPLAAPGAGAGNFRAGLDDAAGVD